MLHRHERRIQPVIVPDAATRATEELLRRSLDLRLHVHVQTRALELNTAQLRTLTEGVCTDDDD